MRKHNGFTLLEILIALFIFTILSMIMVAALHNVIGAHESTEVHAERLRQLQMVLLVMSRDVEQTVNRPVLSTQGHELPAFEGKPQGFTFTHAGYANPNGSAIQSSLQRESYQWSDKALWRMSWDVLDQAPGTKPKSRKIFNDVTNAQFQYLDRDHRYREYWPIEGQSDQPLPRAVKITFTISNWGKISQTYVIPAEIPKAAPQSAPQSTTPEAAT